jgi:uncharacterized protein
MVRVAIDFDNVLADTTGMWIKYYNSIYNKNISKSDLSEYHYWNTLYISKEEAFRIYHQVWSDWKNLPLLEENCISVVSEIERISCEVDVVTSALTDIKDWLNEKGLFFNKVVYTLHKHHLNYDIFIEDSPIEAIGIIRNNKICLLYDQPWNRATCVNEYLIRINSLAQAVDLIKQIKLKCYRQIKKIGKDRFEDE